MGFTIHLLFGSLIPLDNIPWRVVVFFLFQAFSFFGFLASSTRWRAHSDYINARTEEEAEDISNIERTNKWLTVLSLISPLTVLATAWVSVATVLAYAFITYAMFFIHPVITDYRLIREGRLHYPDDHGEFHE